MQEVRSEDATPSGLLYDTRVYHMSPLFEPSPAPLLSATSLTLDMERQASMVPATDELLASEAPLLRIPTDAGGAPTPPPYAQVAARRKKKIIWFSVVGAVAVAVVLSILLSVLLTRGRNKGGAEEVASVAAPGSEPVDSAPAGPAGPTGPPGPANPPGPGTDPAPPPDKPLPDVDASFMPPTLTHDFQGRPRRVQATQGAVAADTGRCSQMGVTVLEEGGNAVDAAIITVLCQGVVNPFASGAGGGFFMSIRSADGETHFIDAREVAPSQATEDMFSGQPANASIYGGRAVAVPLELKGLEKAYKLYGSGIITWKRLVEPVASMASHPILVHPYLQAMIEEKFELLKDKPLMAEAFLIKQGNGWRAPRVQEMCCARPQLAKTLKRVAEEGTTWLYEGEGAYSWAQDVFDAGGIMTGTDLELAQPNITELVTMQVGQYQLHVPPLPSSAAILGLALNILEGYPEPSGTAAHNWVGDGTATKDQLLYQYRLVESIKQMFALRMNLGDLSGITDNKTRTNVIEAVASISDPKFADLLKSDIKDYHVLKSYEYGRQFNPMKDGAVGQPDDHGTSHVSVVDANRLAVAVTSTINTHFGSMVMSASTGILMNNEMDDFSRPDAQSSWGLAPQVANYIAPHKRPLSSMSPIIITQDITQDGEKNGQALRMVIGGSGGPHILTAVLQTIVRTLLMDWDLQDAINVPRVHHQLMPDEVSYENFTLPPYLGNMDFHITEQFRTYLEDKGNDMKAHSSDLGVVQAIFAVPGQHTLVAVSDPRKDGAPAAQADK